MDKGYKFLCLGCGTEEYPKVELNGITVVQGACSKCGEEKTIIPIQDWEENNK